MCDGFSEAAMIAAAVASATAAGAAAYSQNKAAEYNAKVMDENAKDALLRGQQEEAKLRAKADQLRSSQRAGFAASGALVDAGSAGEVIDNTNTMADNDAFTLRYNAWREAKGYAQQGTLSLMSKQNVGMAVGTSLLDSAGSYYKYKGSLKTPSTGTTASNLTPPKD